MIPEFPLLAGNFATWHQACWRSVSRLSRQYEARSEFTVRAEAFPAAGIRAMGPGPEGDASCKNENSAAPILSIAPLVLGGNVFGWTADKKTVVRRARPLRRGRPQRDRHRRRLFGLGAGQQGRRIRDDHRRVDEGAGKSQSRRSSSPRSARRWARARKASRPTTSRRRPRRRSSACRSTRSTSISRTGRTWRRRIEETLGAYQRLIEAGQDPLVRRLEPQRQAARGGARGVQGQGGCRATRFCSRNTISPTARNSKAASPTSASARRSASSPISASPRGSCRASTAARPISRKSPRGGGVKAYLNPRGFRILDALDAVAARHKAKPAEVALAWVMARPGVTAPIASATSVEQTRQPVRATELTLSASRHGRR